MRVLHNTLVNITNEHMGSQSVLFEGTLGCDSNMHQFDEAAGASSDISSS